MPAALVTPPPRECFRSSLGEAKIAQRLRNETPMTYRWIAKRLRMGSASYVSVLVTSVDSELWPPF